jgi:hypothetical protein
MLDGFSVGCPYPDYREMKGQCQLAPDRYLEPSYVYTNYSPTSRSIIIGIKELMTELKCIFPN